MLVALVVTAHLVGLAEEDRVRVRVLRDDAASACPATDELLRAIRDRIGSEPFRNDADARELRIGITKDGDALVARIVLFTPKGQRLGVRVLHGDADCGSLAPDLVLAAAIAIDPLLLVRARPHVDDSHASAAATATTTTTVETDAHDADAPRPEKPAAVVKSTPAPFGLPPPAGVSALVVVGVASGIAPVATPTLRATASFDYGVLDLDAGVRFDLPSRAPAGPALVDTALVAADFAACVDGRLDPNIALSGCGDVDAGGLAVSGVNLRDQRPITAPWLSIGARGAVDVPVLADPAIALVFAGGVASPLLRPRFVDDATGQVFFAPSIFSWDVAVGARIQIR